MSFSDLKISGTERKLQSSLWGEAQYWIDTDISDKPTFELFRMKKFLLHFKESESGFLRSVDSCVPKMHRALFQF
jgi:hypothetical protein